MSKNHRLDVGDVQVGTLAGRHASSRLPCRRAGRQQSGTKEAGNKHEAGTKMARKNDGKVGDKNGTGTGYRYLVPSRQIPVPASTERKRYKRYLM